MTYAETEINALIVRYLAATERRLRLDVAATGPEDDAPPSIALPIRNRPGNASRSKK